MPNTVERFNPLETGNFDGQIQGSFAFGYRTNTSKHSSRFSSNSEASASPLLFDSPLLREHIQILCHTHGCD